MEDAAQKIVHNLDQEREQATDDLREKVGENLNKSGLPEVSPSLDPEHKSQLDQIKHSAEHAVHDALRVGGQTLEEVMGGSHHINEMKANEPLTIAAEKQGKIVGELKKADKI